MKHSGNSILKLSIITVNYNNCDGLRRTLDSVISQKCQDFEWIVIDGGSSDGSKELIEQHQSSISYWCSEPDKGIYNAMNKGVGKATGEYCLFLNSGDILCDSEVIGKLNEISFNADIISCDIYIDGVSKSKLRKSIDYINALWIFENTLFHQSTWIRRTSLIKCPYRENNKSISDWVFFFEALVIHNCSYQHIQMPIAVFYTGGISSKPLPHGNTDRSDFLKLYFPAKFIDDIEKEENYHYVSKCMCRMTKLSQTIMVLIFKVVCYVDYRFFKPIERFFYWKRVRY